MVHLYGVRLGCRVGERRSKQETQQAKCKDHYRPCTESGSNFLCVGSSLRPSFCSSPRPLSAKQIAAVGRSPQRPLRTTRCRGPRPSRAFRRTPATPTVRQRESTSSHQFVNTFDREMCAIFDAARGFPSIRLRVSGGGVRSHQPLRREGRTLYWATAPPRAGSMTGEE